MIGKSWGQGAQHSQGLYSFFMHVPGLKVVAPTTPYDAKGCLIAAIRDDNPVLYVEHRMLHFQKGPVPEEPYTVAPGKARVTAAGERRDARRHLVHAGRVPAGAALPGGGRHPGRGDRSDLAQPARHRHDRRLGRARRAGCWSSTTAGRCCGAAAEIVAQVVERLQGVRDLRVQPAWASPRRPARRRRRWRTCSIPTPAPSPPPPATWSKAPRPAGCPRNVPTSQSIEFKGPF